MPLDDQSKEELIQLLKDVVTEVVEAHPLSQDEIQWVRLAIQAEAERASLRKAIIEKTLAGLIWSCLCGAGLYAVNILKDHWK